jgi:peptidoglycan hydrolase CwlO-like protein
VGDTLKGSFETIANKKKELDESQHRACKREIDYQGQIKTLQDQLEKCQKELKDEQARAKKLEVTLSQLQSDIKKRFEEIRALNGQTHRNLEERN